MDSCAYSFRSYRRLFLLFLTAHTRIHAKIVKIIPEIILPQALWIVPPCPLPGRYKYPVKSPMTADMKYVRVPRISVAIKQPPKRAPAHVCLGAVCFPCSTDSCLVAEIGLWSTPCLTACSTSAKNVSMFFLFLPKSNTCGKRTVMHLLSASITPPGRILTLKSSPHVHPLNGSDARNFPPARALYDQPKSSSADFTTAASSSCWSWYARLSVKRAGNPNAISHNRP